MSKQIEDEDDISHNARLYVLAQGTLLVANIHFEMCSCCILSHTIQKIKDYFLGFLILLSTIFGTYYYIWPLYMVEHSNLQISLNKDLQIILTVNLLILLIFYFIYCVVILIIIILYLKDGGQTSPMKHFEMTDDKQTPYEDGVLSGNPYYDRDQPHL